MFIAIEGLHGVGKSTIVGLLAERLPDAVIVPTIPEELQDARRHIDAQAPVNSRYLFYTAAVSLAAKRVRVAIQSGANVVVESYIHRTIAFHKGLGATIDIDMTSLDLPRPDRVFFLDCDDAVRRERLRSRSRPSTYWITAAEQHTREIRSAYGAFEMVDVDTTGLTPAAVVGQLLRVLHQSASYEERQRTCA